MIRGAVAFGLVLRIDKEVENRPVIVTTALTLVILTTVFMGSTVSTLAKVFFNLKKEEEGVLDHDINASHHEEVMHPNFENTMNKSAVQPGAKSWIRNLDRNKLKPFLLHKPND